MIRNHVSVRDGGTRGKTSRSPKPYGSSHQFSREHVRLRSWSRGKFDQIEASEEVAKNKRPGRVETFNIPKSGFTEV